jgi:uroporphyrinogen-III decarboxylase
MYRVPDKLLAAIELLTEMQLNTLISDAKNCGNPRVPLWLHRGAASFMSNEQFEKFYWPSLRKLMIGLVDAGLTPIPYFQGDYTPRLPYLAELPKGKIPFHFDVIDRKEARAQIGGLNCFWGNVSATLLITGTPKQVREDVIDLIDHFGDTGGLIIDGAATIPDEAKPENVEAMTAAVLEYGRN